MNLEKEFIMNAIKNYILSDKILKNNIISIYSMGSFAKNDIFSDADLNFFVRENNSKVIKSVRKMIDYFLKEYGLYLDINIIDNDMIDNNFLNSKLFIHRNRHSMILYELKCLDNNLIYGPDILSNLNYSIEDIMIEALKLSLTIRHTICKLYMQKEIPNQLMKTIKKNSRYEIEFYLLFKGIKNPYNVDIESYIMKYDFLKNNKNIIKNIYNQLYNNISLSNYYDFIVNISSEIKNNMLYIVKNKVKGNYYNIDRLIEKYERQF